MTTEGTFLTGSVLIPREAWKYLCDHVSRPLSIVGPNQYFVWVNAAFEDLLGYSNTELKTMTWLDVTVSKDVPGDLQSARELTEGRKTQYTLSKTYRHRRGHEVPIRLTIWRWPRDGRLPLEYYLGEEEPLDAMASEKQAQEIQELFARLKQMELTMSEAEKGEDKNRESHKQVVNVGNNSADVIKWLIVGVSVLGLVLAYIAYYAIWRQGMAPPVIPIPQP